jgi:hypothetical protein
LFSKSTPPTEDNIDVTESFCEELERVFDKLPKYHMKMLLEDFNAKIGREDVFKLTIGDEILDEIFFLQIFRNLL